MATLGYPRFCRANTLLPPADHFCPLYVACQNGRFEVALLLLGK